MMHSTFRRLTILLRNGLLTGSLIFTGCAKEKPWLTSHYEPPARIARGAEQPEKLPEPTEHVKSKTASVVHERPPVPITLDTVLRLAEGQNKQIALARERVYETHINKELADLAWIPEINVGFTWFRHEGGIQNEPGPLVRSSTGALQAGGDLNAKLNLREKIYQQVNAERQIWQQKGELSQVTSEKLVESANAYLDLMMARNAEAVLDQMKEKEAFPLKWSKDRFEKVDPRAKILYDMTLAQSKARQQVQMQLDAQAGAATAKLAHVLGMPHAKLIPGESRLAPVSLVDTNRPTEALIAQAVHNGPGVQELSGLLATIQKGIHESTSWKAYAPIVEMRMLEAAFGAGQGSTLDFDNRWDLGLQFRWNLNEFFTSDQKLRQAHSRLYQAQLTYEELQSKLAAGVRTAHQVVLQTRKQLELATEQIKLAMTTYDEAKSRLENNQTDTTTEMMQAIQSLQSAQLAALNLIRNHNKAQVQLLVLLGPMPHNTKEVHHSK